MFRARCSCYSPRGARHDDADVDAAYLCSSQRRQDPSSAEQGCGSGAKENKKRQKHIFGEFFTKIFINK
jgi:hypothetical protein